MFHRFVCQYVVVEIVIVIWFDKALGILQKYCKINEARQQYFIQYFHYQIKSNMRHKRKDETRKCFTVKHENA